MIDKIDKNTKWNDYVKEHGDTLYFLSKDNAEIYMVYEGSGNNISKEDIDEGFVDYFGTYYYTGEDSSRLDYGGDWLEEEFISDMNYTIQDVIDRMKQCDAPDDIDEWEILDPDVVEDTIQNLQLL